MLGICLLANGRMLTSFGSPLDPSQGRSYDQAFGDPHFLRMIMLPSELGLDQPALVDSSGRTPPI